MTNGPSARVLSLGVAAAALAGMLVGCGEEPIEPGLQRKYRVALIMKSLANEFFQTMEEGAKAHQAKNADRYELIANGIKDERDVARQIDLVRQMISQKVDAIIIAPADSKALVAVCKEALDSNIVVVNIDNKLDEETLVAEKAAIPFVGPDNRRGARLVGEFLAQKLKPKDQVVIVEGIPTAINAVMRKLGFEAAMGAAKIEVATSQTAEWETNKAKKLVANIIIEHPNIKAVLCANDSMALGAVTALEEAGKLGSVLVVGYDNITAVQQLIQEGKVLATADQHADKIAVFGIQHALDILEKKAKPKDKETPVDLVTADSLK